MQEPDRITFFRSYYDAMQQMQTQRDKLSFLEGMLAYAFDGTEIRMTSAANTVFSVVKPYIDTSKKRANAKKNGKNLQVKSPENREETEDFVPTSCANNKNMNQKKKKETEKHKYGEYGWILLTDAQYGKLLTELGETELERCVRVVDEAAQKTGNKNGWKDWNLVIRACHRDGWGLQTERRGGCGSDRLSGEPAKPEQDWNIIYD